MTTRTVRSTATQRPSTLSPVPSPPPTPRPAPEQPPPGVLLRSYRLSLRSIDWTGTTLGGTALGSLRLVGLPKGASQKLTRGQARGLHAVTGWSDRMGTHWAHGVGAGQHYAVEGGKLAFRGWKREMKFFITLH